MRHPSNNNSKLKRFFHSTLIGSQTQEIASQVKSESGLSTWRARRDWRKRQTIQMDIGNRCNKQGNLHTKLILGGHKTSRSLFPPTKTLKVYIEALTGFSHVYHSNGLNNSMSFQGCVLENGSGCGNGGQKTYSKDRAGGREPLIAQVQLEGQPTIRSSGWLPPTTIETHISLPHLPVDYIT